VDDAVMGGESSSTFNLNDDGFGFLKAVYHLRTMEDFLCALSIPKKQVKEYTSIVIKLQGDGKEYQFRIKSNSGDYYSYIAPFSTRRMARNSNSTKRHVSLV
jgi:hypothetical protein